MKHLLLTCIALFATCLVPMQAQWFGGATLEYQQYSSASELRMSNTTQLIGASVDVLQIPIVPKLSVHYKVDSTFSTSLSIAYKSLQHSYSLTSSLPTWLDTTVLFVQWNNELNCSVRAVSLQACVHARIFDRLMMSLGIEANRKLSLEGTESLTLNEPNRWATTLPGWTVNARGNSVSRNLRVNQQELGTMWIQGIVGARYEIPLRNITIVPSIQYAHSLNSIRDFEENYGLVLRLQSLNAGIEILFPL